MIDRQEPGPRAALRAVLLTAVALYAIAGPLLGGALAVAAVAGTGDLGVASPWAWAGLAGVGAVLVGVALLPSFLLAGGLGALSGVWGYPLAAAAIALSLVVGIGLARALRHGTVDELLRRRPAWHAEYERLQGHGTAILWGILLSRLSPHVPFAAANLLLGQLRLNLGRLVLVSWLGMLPRTLLAVAAGQTLDELASLAALRAELPWAWAASAALGLGLAVLALRALTRRIRARLADPRSV